MSYSQYYHPLSYVNQAVSHLLDHDALLIVAPGLGLHGILLEFLRQFHIQKGCHPGAQGRSGKRSPIELRDKNDNAHQYDGIVEKPGSSSTISTRRFVGAPEQAEPETVAGASRSSSELNCNAAKAAKVDHVAGDDRKLGSRLVFLLNTSDEEARIIKERAEMLGLVGKYHENEGRNECPKRRKLNHSDKNVRPAEVSETSTALPLHHINPFIEDSPVKLSFYIHGQSSQTDLPEQRQAEYSKGGICVVKSRLLVTDILTGRLPPEIIDGVIVNHVER